MSAIWEPADEIRKVLNWVAPIVVIATSILWAFVIYPALYRPQGFFGFFESFGAPSISGWVITYLICGLLSGILYFIPKLGPFIGVRDNDLYVWPEHIMMIICTGLAWYGSWFIGGAVMAVQFLMVCILGSNPIWEASTSRA